MAASSNHASDSAEPSDSANYLTGASDVATVGDPICLQQFLNEWLLLLDEEDMGANNVTISQSSMPVGNFSEFAQREMKVSAEMIAELEIVCRPPGAAADSSQTDTMSLLKTVPSNHNLLTLRFQQQELHKRDQDPGYRWKILDKMKYRSRDGPWKHDEWSKEPAEGRKLATKPDLILTVQVYRSYIKKKSLILEQEFEVLGQQRLTELRDVIYCLADHTAVGDFNENPDHPIDIIAKDVYKSGFFFIEGVFYNDMRYRNCIDYSRVILDWSRNPSRGVGPFDDEHMESTFFSDLTIRPGQPYLYMHQGNCEHLVVFSDVRLMHFGDCPYLDKYPMQTYRSRERRPKCRVCQLYLATWVAHESPLSPEDPSFFCDTCFRGLHFNKAGEIMFKRMRIHPYPVINVK